MAYNPVPLGEKAQFDADEAILKAQTSASTSLSTNEQSFPTRARKNLRNPVAGTVEGEAGLPTSVAPLVYPGATTATQAGPETATGRNAMKRIANYFDQRAQARYVSCLFYFPLFPSPAFELGQRRTADFKLTPCLQAKESKGDVLSHPSPPSFTNRYLDPNHPATNGGLLGLVSGGHLTEKLNQRAQSNLRAQTQAIRDQQAAMIESLRQQLTLMNLPPEQEQAYMDHYMAAFELQEQQLSQQANLYNSETGQVRKIRVLLPPIRLICAIYTD